MDELVKNLMEELNCDTAFTIPIFGGIPVAESVFVTWLIMAVVILLCAIFVRNLKVTNPGKGQLLLETAVSGIYSFFEDILGEKGKGFIPYLMSVGIYIGIANLIGILGFKPPTKDINVTASLAILSIILIELSGVLAKGGRGWLKSFAEPMVVILPINILEIFIRPLSLCMRLFGNVPWLVCHYGIAEDGRPGHPAAGIQLLLRYIRRADPGIRFCIPDRIIY